MIDTSLYGAPVICLLSRAVFSLKLKSFFFCSLIPIQCLVTFKKKIRNNDENFLFCLIVLIFYFGFIYGPYLFTRLIRPKKKNDLLSLSIFFSKLWG